MLRALWSMHCSCPAEWDKNVEDEDGMYGVNLHGLTTAVTGMLV